VAPLTSRTATYLDCFMRNQLFLSRLLVSCLVASITSPTNANESASCFRELNKLSNARVDFKQNVAVKISQDISAPSQQLEATLVKSALDALDLSRYELNIQSVSFDYKYAVYFSSEVQVEQTAPQEVDRKVGAQPEFLCRGLLSCKVVWKDIVVRVPDVTSKLVTAAVRLPNIITDSVTLMKLIKVSGERNTIDDILSQTLTDKMGRNAISEQTLQQIVADRRSADRGFDQATNELLECVLAVNDVAWKTAEEKFDASTSAAMAAKALLSQLSGAQASFFLEQIRDAQAGTKASQEKLKLALDIFTRDNMSLNSRPILFPTDKH
jgi:hypothetical protein